jgi:SpoVK/Ycf46/Vps4 family AAA+-type ATPase
MSDEPTPRWQQHTSDYPEWAQELARKYFTKTITQFILHGNVRDLVRTRTDGQPSYQTLHAFLTREMFASRDVVIGYDRAGGIQFPNEGSQVDFNRAITGYDSTHGTEFSEQLPRDPVRVFTLLENYFRTRLREGTRLGCIIDYAETIAPMAGAAMYSSEDRSALVFLQKWARDPQFTESDFTLCLITENLRDINQQLVRSPYTASIMLPYPDEREREQFITRETQASELQERITLPAQTLVQYTAGLNLIQLRTLLAEVRENRTQLTGRRLSARKKEIIEAEAHGLLEFVEPDQSLDDVAGHHAVKELLRHAVQALRRGHHDVLPMGYLVCGPVGVGKTFLITCFAGELGIPMVKLKNFRSQWQGVTEGNLEKILHLLEAMAPIAVMIDEADAALGNRAERGDAGVSRRVFGQLASFMSDTDHRGRILWFLVTARPDLMPVDLKRQGRAEEHLALFYPSTRKERTELIKTMMQKARIDIDVNEVPEPLRNGELKLSGADLEAVFTRARFEAAAGESSPDNPLSVTPDLLERVVANFIPPTYPEEIELQTVAAMLECTRRELLPTQYRQLDPEDLVERLDRLKQRRSSPGLR